MKLKKLFGALAASAALAAAVPAQAGVIGMADLAIKTFLLVSSGSTLTPGGVVPITTADVTLTSDSRTGNATSSFNGVDGTGIGSSNIGPQTGAVDVKYRCAGAGCATVNATYGGTVENNTTTHLGAPSGNFALGDMYISGSAIDSTGANGLTRADSSVQNATNAGSANATILNNVNALTTFTANTTMGVKFLLDYNAFLSVFIDALTPGQTANASAAFSWSLSLKDLGTPTVPHSPTNVLSWTPDDINNGIAAATPSDNYSVTTGGPIFSDVFNLIGGHKYTLVINQASNSTASLIPEPGSLLLVGLGLFALAMTSRRRLNR
ncbi:MAG: EDSAP-1 family PEP-CTERM protein [Pseudomonadota bacterium]